MVHKRLTEATIFAKTLGTTKPCGGCGDMTALSAKAIFLSYPWRPVPAGTVNTCGPRQRDNSIPSIRLPDNSTQSRAVILQYAKAAPEYSTGCALQYCTVLL